jgi:hypothetical protein
MVLFLWAAPVLLFVVCGRAMNVDVVSELNSAYLIVED